MATGYIKY